MTKKTILCLRDLWLRISAARIFTHSTWTSIGRPCKTTASVDRAECEIACRPYQCCSVDHSGRRMCKSSCCHTRKSCFFAAWFLGLKQDANLLNNPPHSRWHWTHLIPSANYCTLSRLDITLFGSISRMATVVYVLPLRPAMSYRQYIVKFVVFSFRCKWQWQFRQASTCDFWLDWLLAAAG